MSGRGRPKQVIFASDRGPVQFCIHDGVLQATRRAGSVTEVLNAAAGRLPIDVTWFSVGDQQCSTDFADGDPLLRGEGLLNCKLVLLPIEISVRNAYYYDASVRAIWFALHDLWRDLPSHHVADSAVTAYAQEFTRVNETFASSIVSRTPESAPILVHDYQLCLTPRMLRKLSPNRLISYFNHVAFATVESLSVLPREVAVDILGGILGADLVGFHSYMWARRFMECCQYFLNASVHANGTVVRWEGREIVVRVFPLTVDEYKLSSLVSLDESQHWKRVFDHSADETLIARVERLDPSKNTVRGLEAFELLLDEFSEDFRAQLHLVACLMPSREHVPEYEWYRDRLMKVARRIEKKYPEALQIYYEENRARALALLMCADVVVVDSVADGMNLVAQEAVVLNGRHCSLVLSRNAGCSEIFPAGPVAIHNARNIREITSAMRHAVERPLDDRATSLMEMRTALSPLGGPSEWINCQLEELSKIDEKRASGSQ